MTRRDLLIAVSVLGLAPAIAAGRVKREVRRDLYNCEGCEAVGERAPRTLSSVVRLSPKGEPGTPLVLTGRVMSADGSKPVADVVIYAHQTDARGYYSRGRPGTQWSLRHGLLRGWAKTDVSGRFTFITIKPAPYPSRGLPAHIHLFIGEPGRRPYYIDDVVFAGEFGVTPRYIAAQELRGGSGIVRLQRRSDGVLTCTRNIMLERHPE